VKTEKPLSHSAGLICTVPTDNIPEAILITRARGRHYWRRAPALCPFDDIIQVKWKLLVMTPTVAEESYKWALWSLSLPQPNNQ
jgi:hypothetical protein